MKLNEIKPNIQDFSTVDTNLGKIKEDQNLRSKIEAFYFFVMDLLLNLQDDEIKDSITDTSFLSGEHKDAGHDRGIDAIFIEQTETKNKIHLFNFKYAETFEKTKSFFPAKEIDKIVTFLNALLSKDKGYLKGSNLVLCSKIETIWEIYETENPDYVLHICSNYYNSFESSEKERFEREINKNSNFEIKYHLINELVNLLTKKGKINVNAKISAIDKQFFEKTDGDVKALIVNVDVVDLLRICSEKEDLRTQPCLEDRNALKVAPILEDVFEDNVRIYLKQRSKINRNIKNTALSNEGHRVFYYNNGITITCEHVEYPSGNRRSPIIELTNLQVVNGSQTIHALHEAFLEDSSKFDDMTILCRIYETRNKQLSTKIAEYTNSQNPVNSRDIRSIDYIQLKLEKELEAVNYFYERKKNQYSGKPKEKRLDAEKVGQVIMSLFNQMPSEAKDKKRIIFAEKYDEIFNDNMNADKVLIAVLLFRKIEAEKNKLKDRILSSDHPSFEEYEENAPLFFSSYWILYLLGKIGEIKKIKIVKENLDKLWGSYDIAARVVIDIWNEEKAEIGDHYKYSFEHFFKKTKPMEHIDRIFDSAEINNYIAPKLEESTKTEKIV